MPRLEGLRTRPKEGVWVLGERFFQWKCRFAVDGAYRCMTRVASNWLFRHSSGLED